MGGIEEFFRGGERICQKTSGLQYAPQRLTKGFIIINNSDDPGLELSVVQFNSPDLRLDETFRKQGG